MILVLRAIIFLEVVTGCAAGGNITRYLEYCKRLHYKLVEGKFCNENHWLCLKMVDLASSPLASNINLIVPVPRHTPTATNWKVQNITMAHGFPVADPSSGSAEGYIAEDHQFYGVLHLGNRILHADPYGYDSPEKTYGAFEDYGVSASVRSRRFYDKQYPYYNFNVQRPNRVPGVARARICELLLLADKMFFERAANSSLDHAVRRMMHAVDQADVVFRNSDFNEDGVPDNIGFTVKYIIVLTSFETNRRVFGDLLDKRVVDGSGYLMKFARLRRLSDVCLGVAFSGHAFINRTLGISFTSLGGGLTGAAGGLCDKRAIGRSFNTLAIAHSTSHSDKTRVPERLAALTLAHELGHSFGALHDDTVAECRGYLMGSQSTTASDPKHFEFSVCSKRLVSATLKSMSYCLVDENKQYCGNGIVENGESCDCGLPSRCSKMDPCCTPRAGAIVNTQSGPTLKEGCLVSPSAQCHPSQGPCCTQRCKYSNFTMHGINCEKQHESCACAEVSRDCGCGLGGACAQDGSCHAKECVMMGLRECQCMPPRGKAVNLTLSCEVCCRMKNSSECVNAAEAARQLYNNRDLPYYWLNDDYDGRRCSSATL